MVGPWGVGPFNYRGGGSEGLFMVSALYGLGFIGLVVVLNLITTNVIMDFRRYGS